MRKKRRRKKRRKKKRRKKKKKTKRKQKWKKKKTFFAWKLNLNLRTKLLKRYIFSTASFIVLKVGYFGKQVRNSWKVLKCGAGEGRRRSVGPIV